MLALYKTYMGVLHDADEVYVGEDLFEVFKSVSDHAMSKLIPVMALKGPVVAYVSRNNLTYMQWIVSAVAEYPEFTHHIYIVPEISYVCRHYLEKAGASHHVTLSALPITLLPLANDSYSLYCDDVFSRWCLDQDMSVLKPIACSINQHFSYKHVHTYGDGGSIVAKLLQPNHADDKINVDTVVLIDRSVDLITPLTTAMTLEGLCHEFTPDVAIDPTLGRLDFTHVGSEIRSRLREIQRNTSQHPDKLRELKDYIRTTIITAVKDKEMLAQHLATAASIRDCMNPVWTRMHRYEQHIVAGEDSKDGVDYIEEGLFEGNKSKYDMIRLICLLAMTNKIDAEVYEDLRKHVMHTYSFLYRILFERLEKLGMVSFRKPRHRRSIVDRVKVTQGKRVLVYVIGGISYAEVSAIRKLSIINKVTYIIAGTCMLGKNSLIQSLDPT